MPLTDNKTVRDRLVIIALSQAVIYTLLWLWNEYVATYLTIIFPSIMLFLIIISAIADLIEPSRMPRWYYKLMLMSFVIPLVIGVVFFYIYEGNFDYLRN